jgi:hypothetical protein
MLVINNRFQPRRQGQSDAAFWADLINVEDGDDAILVDPRGSLTPVAPSETGSPFADDEFFDEELGDD